jgi:hypothetical protein
MQMKASTNGGFDSFDSAIWKRNEETGGGASKPMFDSDSNCSIRKLNAFNFGVFTAKRVGLGRVRFYFCFNNSVIVAIFANDLLSPISKIGSTVSSNGARNERRFHSLFGVRNVIKEYDRASEGGTRRRRVHRECRSFLGRLKKALLRRFSFRSRGGLQNSPFDKTETDGSTNSALEFRHQFTFFSMLKIVRSLCNGQKLSKKIISKSESNSNFEWISNPSKSGIDGCSANYGGGAIYGGGEIFYGGGAIIYGDGAIID